MTPTMFKLRHWRSGDEKPLAYHANNINIWNNVRDYFPYPYTINHAFDWVNRMHTDPYAFAITVDNLPVGGISLVQQSDIYRKNAEIGYWLGEDFWGQGIITEAVRQVVQIGFETLDICRIYAGIFEFNQASMRVVEKSGFRHEATLPKSVFKNGQLWDDVIYAIRREDVMKD